MALNIALGIELFILEIWRKGHLGVLCECQHRFLEGRSIAARPHMPEFQLPFRKAPVEKGRLIKHLQSLSAEVPELIMFMK